MKLQTRLSLLISLIILITSTAIGYFAISTTYGNQLKILDSTVSQVLSKLSKSNEDPLSLSTYLADQSYQKFSVDYVTQELDLIPLYEGTAQLTSTPSVNQLIQSLNGPTTIGEVRLRTFLLSPGEYLLLYFSISDLNVVKSKNIHLLLIFTLIIMVIAISLTILIFRKDNQLNLLVNSLQKNQDRIEEFIGDASHELRTPLTVIKGYFELLSKNNNDEDKLNSYKKRIESEILRMQEIINDLLLIVELDQPKTLGTESAQISKLIQEQIFDIGNFQPKRKIETKIELGLSTKISQFHLEQLLANIFSNIKRHTPFDSQIEICLQKRGNQVELIIEDAGSGLPKNFYQSGIQAFKRFDKSRSRESGGSGLGMTIMEKIISKNNGKITLSSGKFGGLRIQILLPIQQK